MTWVISIGKCSALLVGPRLSVRRFLVMPVSPPAPRQNDYMSLTVWANHELRPGARELFYDSLGGWARRNSRVKFAKPYGPAVRPHL